MIVNDRRKEIGGNSHEENLATVVIKDIRKISPTG
jgi:hypothetical protein